MHVHEHLALAGALDAQHAHGGFERAMVDTVVEHARQPRDDAPLAPRGDEAFPRGPQLGRQFVIGGIWCRVSRVGRDARALGIDAQARPLLAQLGIFLVVGMARVSGIQEPVPDGASEFFSVSLGLSAAAWASV